MPPKRDRRLKSPEDKVKAISFSISQRDLDTLIKLGNGNASAGVRRLLGMLDFWGGQHEALIKKHKDIAE